jgi:general L-amino acid transport system substrate-binding protein
VSDEIIESVKRRDRLNCGVSQGILGMSSRDPNGRWVGFDVDFARAIAAAVLGDADKIEYVSLRPDARFVALAARAIDVLCCNATYTFTRDVGLGISFAAITCYDGETLIVRRDLGIQRVQDLGDAVVAFQSGTTTQANLTRHLSRLGVQFAARSYPTPQAALDAYDAGECSAYALDRIPLTGERLRLARPDDHVLLPETFSKEPMGPAVPGHDPSWRRLVAWVVHLVIEAEELGISSANIDDKLAAHDFDLEYLIQVTDAQSEHLGIAPGWVGRVLRQVGNYHEIFDRNLGVGSSLKLPRGQNASWMRGGLLYAVPFK